MLSAAFVEHPLNGSIEQGRMRQTRDGTIEPEMDSGDRRVREGRNIDSCFGHERGDAFERNSEDEGIGFNAFVGKKRGANGSVFDRKPLQSGAVLDLDFRILPPGFFGVKLTQWN